MSANKCHPTVDLLVWVSLVDQVILPVERHVLFQTDAETFVSHINK